MVEVSLDRGIFRITGQVKVSFKLFSIVIKKLNLQAIEFNVILQFFNKLPS